MKVPIVVWIEPHEDGRRCGGCTERFYVGIVQCWRLDGVGYRVRGPVCLAAAKAMADLVEAGNNLVMAEGAGETNDAIAAWDRAVDAATGPRSGPVVITVEVLQQQSRLAALREVREMVATKRVKIGNTMATVLGIVSDIDAMIAKEEKP